MKDFWISSGHHLLDRGSDGGLHVTDEFLKLYLARPELIPPAEACAVERTLHAALLADPRMPVSASDINAIADADSTASGPVAVADPALFSMSLGYVLTTTDADAVANNAVFARVVNRGLTEVTVVPEPASMALVGVGMLGVLGHARRRRAAH